VKKTTVYLRDDEVERLAALAAREQTTKAEIMRRAIRRYRPSGRGDREFALAAVGDGPGGSIAELDDGELLEGFGS
jgi:predicted transcriptional regulator